jgi:aminopeptidase N
MKNLAVLFLSVITCCTCSLFSQNIQAQNADATSSAIPVQWQRARTIDVQHIALDLRFDWAKQQAYGTASITLAPLFPSNTIALDAGQLAIQHITLAKTNTPLTFEYDGGDRDNGLVIHLNRTYAALQPLTIVVQYHTTWVNSTDPNNTWGSYGKGLRFFEPTAVEPTRRRQIWSMGEPAGNRYWFPGYDAPNDVRTFELTATVAENLSVISTGTLVKNRKNADGTRTFHWKSTGNCANHQNGLIVGEYVDYQQKLGMVTLHNYGYPDEIQAVKASVERLPDMVRFFTEKTRAPFPFATYRQVFIQEFPWGGGAQQGLSAISENMIDDFGTHADFFYLWDGVEAQDLAAQWFGNLVSPADWQHIWLTKAFARYFDDLYSEHKNGLAEMLLWNRPFEQSTYLGNWYAGLRRPVVTRQYDHPATLTTDNHVSTRGAMVLHMLRRHLGDDLWWKVIRQYFARYAHCPVDTESFRKVVENVSGEPMDWFFDQWLYRMGHPVFEIEKQYDPATKFLQLHVRQVQQLDSSSSYPQQRFFQGKMTLAINGQLEHVWLKPVADNVFQFSCAEPPKLVRFDYEDTWIKEVRYPQSVAEWLYQFEQEADMPGRRTAMMELSGIARQDSTAPEVKQKIIDAFHTAIASTAYWRFRYGVLLQLQGIVAPHPNEPANLGSRTIALLRQVIRQEKSWNRAAAIGFLGTARNPAFAPEFEKMLQDSSDRVVNAAAIALGKSKAPGAFEALAVLPNKPSWKNQSLISALNGLKALGDPRGGAIALQALQQQQAPHWTLATPVWDHRLAAAETLAALKQADLGYPVVQNWFRQASETRHLHDLFTCGLFAATLADPRGQEIFDALKTMFQSDANALTAVQQLEAQFQSAQQ